MIGTILLFILVLSLLVFVHEFGHFIMAKKMGMKVEEFGFGFPPRIWGYKPKGSETTYTVNWIPLGGFVKIKGESGQYKNDPDSFASKAAWRRLVVLVAGVVMNLVLAAVLLSGGFMIGLPSVIDESTPASATVRDAEIRIISVVPESPAERANMESGDILVSIDGRIFDTAEEARTYIGAEAGSGVEILFARDENGERMFYTEVVTSESLKEVDQVGVGVGLIKTGLVSFPVHLAVWHGVLGTGSFTYEVGKSFFDLIRNLVVKQEVSVDLSGPVGIAVLTGEVAALGFVYLLQFTALLSINLAIINILPFPALDGGRVLFLIIEKVRGKAVDQRVEGLVHTIGFALLMVLVLLVTYRDFVKFGGQIWGAIKSIVGA